jgi:hypothetical protein
MLENKNDENKTNALFTAKITLKKKSSLRRKSWVPRVCFG